MSEKTYKILDRAKMPDGTDIQIEDWKEAYPGIFNTVLLAAYPKAKMDGRHGFVRKGERFRLELNREFNSDAEVYEVYEGLKSGLLKLEDLDKHYYNGDKDRFYMGFESVSEEPRYYNYRYKKIKQHFIRGNEMESALWKVLEPHIGHTIEIVKYGEVNISIEDRDTNEVILDTDVYDLIGINGGYEYYR